VTVRSTAKNQVDSGIRSVPTATAIVYCLPPSLCDRVASGVDVGRRRICGVKLVGCRNDWRWRARIIPASSQARASLRVCSEK